MKSDRQLTKPSVQMLKHKNIYVEAYLCCHSNSVQRLGKIFTNFPVAVIHKQQIPPNFCLRLGERTSVLFKRYLSSLLFVLPF